MSRSGFKDDQDETAKPATHPQSGVTAGRAHPRAGAPAKKKTRPAKKTSRDQSR
jgi:hypothetical protein